MDKEIYKDIPGNDEWTVTLSGKFKPRKGVDRATPLNRKGNYVSIKMFGKVCWTSVYWLSLVSYYELTDKKVVDRAIFGLEPNDITINPSGNWMLFSTPINEKGLRIIPRYTRYRISKFGDVYGRRSDKLVKPNVVEDDTYPTINVYDPVYSTYRDVFIHRLVALAWVYNTNPYTMNVVDHVDSNKSNYKCTNLEWVTPRENIVRAHKNRNNSQSQPVKIRNIHTKEIFEFYSIGELARYLGISSHAPIKNALNGLNKGLLDMTHEIKLIDDASEWKYTSDNIPTANSRNNVYVTHPDGKVETIYGITELTKRFKLWNIYPATMSNRVKIAIERNPGLDIRLEVLSTRKVCYVLDTHEEKEYIFDNMTDAGKHMGLGRSTIRQWCLRYDKRYLFKNRWKLHLGVKDFDEWPKETLYKDDNKQAVVAHNIKTGDVFQFESVRETARKTKVSRTEIKRRLYDGGLTYGTWKFEYFTDSNEQSKN